MLFRTSPLKWKRCSKAESMPWVRPSSGQHPHATQRGIHPAGPPSKQGWLWGSPALETSENTPLLPNTTVPGSLSILERGTDRTTPGTRPALPDSAWPRLTQSGSDPCNSAQPQRLLCICYGCSSLRSPWTWRDPKPCRHEHLLPSPTHHLKTAEQLHINSHLQSI